VSEAQVVGEKIGDGGLVVDDQDSGGHAPKHSRIRWRSGVRFATVGSGGCPSHRRFPGPAEAGPETRRRTRLAGSGGDRLGERRCGVSSLADRSRSHARIGDGRGCPGTLELFPRSELTRVRRSGRQDNRGQSLGLPDLHETHRAGGYLRPLAGTHASKPRAAATASAGLTCCTGFHARRHACLIAAEARWPRRAFVPTAGSADRRREGSTAGRTARR
jgi:hypothetical protein